jgi:uncharacterized membrane protein YbaN (DUF454 family)
MVLGYGQRFIIFYLKVMTSALRLTILWIEKKSKRKLERKLLQSPCLLSTVRSYQILALPLKEKEKNFHLKVSSDMPAMCRQSQVCSKSHGCR